MGLVQCVDFPGTCSKHDACNARELYQEMHTALLGVLDRYTLADMRARQIELNGETGGHGSIPDLCTQGGESEPH